MCALYVPGLKTTNIIDATDCDVVVQSITQSPIVYFTAFKYEASGTIVSDNQALANALSMLGASGGTLVIDAAAPLLLTSTLVIRASVTIMGLSPVKNVTATLLGVQDGDMIRVLADHVTLVGLNINTLASSGSAIVLAGINDYVSGCNIANVPGNHSTVVTMSASDDHIDNTYFTNWEPTAFSWSVTATNGGNSGSSVRGGWAYGPGQGGEIGDGSSGFLITDFSIAGWDCVTTGLSQVVVASPASVAVQGGVYDQSTGSAFVLGPNAASSSLSIDGAFISTAGNMKSGVAIEVQPGVGSSVANLSVLNSFICDTGEAVQVSGNVSQLTLIGNVFTTSSRDISSTGQIADADIIANQFGSSPTLAPATLSSLASQTVYVGNIVSGLPQAQTAIATLAALQAFAAGGGDVSANGSGSSAQSAALAAAFVQPSITMDGSLLQTGGTQSASRAFTQFLVAPNGALLSDDAAFAAAIAWCTSHHSTLIIDSGLTVMLSSTVVIGTAINIVGDGSSEIVSSASGVAFDIESVSASVFSGLHILDTSDDGSAVLMGGNGTTLTNCELENQEGNHATMVSFRGANQLIQNTRFVNNDPQAYSWSALYIDSSDHLDISSEVVGGSATGVGNGGFIGGGTTAGRIEGFQVAGWNCSTTGSTQINAQDVFSLQITGGSYGGSSASAISLGGGKDGALSVNISGVRVSGANATAGTVGIQTDPSTGGGVNDLTITNTSVTGMSVGISLGAGTGYATLTNNVVSATSVGLNVVDPAADLQAIGNVLTAPTALALTEAPTGGATQQFMGNTLNGSVQIQGSNARSISFSSNDGTAAYLDPTGVTLQPSTPVISANGWSELEPGDYGTNTSQPTFSGTAQPGSTVTVFKVVAGVYTSLGSVGANNTGAWSLRSGNLVDSTYVVGAIAQDDSGNTSLASPTLSLTVNTSMPAAPTICAVMNGSESTQVRISGTATANTLVIVAATAGGHTISLGSTTASAAGSWLIDVVLPSGMIDDITATTINAVGSSSRASNTWRVLAGQPPTGLAGTQFDLSDLVGANISVTGVVDIAGQHIVGQSVLVAPNQLTILAASELKVVSETPVVIAPVTPDVQVSGPSSAIASATSAGTSSIDSGILVNDGTISVEAGATLVIAASLDNTGALTVAPGGVLDLQTGIATSDLGAVDGGGQLVLAGTLDNTGAVLALATLTGFALSFGDAGSGGMLEGGMLQAGGATLQASTSAAPTVLSGVAVVGLLDVSGSVEFTGGTTFAAASGGGAGALKVESGTTVLDGYATLHGLSLELVNATLSATAQTGLAADVAVTVSGDARIDGSVTASGAVGVDGGDTLTVGDASTAASTVVAVGNGATLVAAHTVRGTMRFAGTLGALELTGAGALSATLNQFQAGDSVRLDAMTSGALSLAGSTLTVSGAGSTAVFQLSGSGDTPYTLGDFQLAAGPGGALVLSTTHSLSAAQNPLFDPAYYLAHYGAQVAASGLTPYQHFLQLGWKAGFNPDAWFDTAFYLKENPAVAASGVNPLLQYESVGWRSGQLPSLLFSGAAYAAANPGSAGTDPLIDFIQSGAAASGAGSYAPGQGAASDRLVQASYLFPQLGATLLPAGNQDAAAAAVYKAGAWRTMANPDPLFDTTFYMDTHRAEVLASGLDPLTHYETVGWREGYDPSLLFSTQAYLAAHPAAAASGLDPLTYSLTSAQAAPQTVHSLFATASVVAAPVRLDPLLDTTLVAKQIATLLPTAGADPAAVNKAYQQGAWQSVSQPNALFESFYYLGNNPDVAAAGMDPLTHYEMFGAHEGRDPNPLFDTGYYLATNPDVAASGINPLLHFEVFGTHEGRNPSPLFNTSYYLSHNPDVAAAGVDALQHFEDTGWHEGRDPDALFDTSYYLSHNPDVAASGMDPLIHYDEFGWKEGRDPSAAFNTNAYLQANPDVRAAGMDPLAHYLEFGAHEGRAIYAVR